MGYKYCLWCHFGESFASLSWLLQCQGQSHRISWGSTVNSLTQTDDSSALVFLLQLSSQTLTVNSTAISHLLLHQGAEQCQAESGWRWGNSKSHRWSYHKLVFYHWLVPHCFTAKTVSHALFCPPMMTIPTYCSSLKVNTKETEELIEKSKPCNPISTWPGKIPELLRI